MKKLLITLLTIALVLCSAALAEYRPATASPTPPPNGWVRGVVTDKEDGTIKLSKVTVSTDGKTVQTDAQGCYEMELKPGSYTLTFTKNEYVLVTAAVQVEPARETIKDVSMEKEQGWVRGVVTDAQDSSVKLAGVTVSVAGKTVQTDAQGKYELQLKPGSWELTFTKDGYLEATHTVKVNPDKETKKNCALTCRQGWVSGVVSDATDSSIKLSGVTVSVDGQSVQTNSRGEYELKLEPGAKILSYEKDGFITITQNVQVSSGNRTKQDCSMSEELDSNQYRVVLEWGTTPKDLDSHLRGYSSLTKPYHVYYPEADRRPPAANNEAWLDRDDRDGIGPETITFYVTNNSSYILYVHDFTNRATRMSNSLAQSSATVTVYHYRDEPKVYRVPAGSGTYWEVFRITNGVFTPVNKIRTEEPIR